MNYLLIALLASIGWHIGKVVFEVLGEVIFMRLHKTKWYAVVTGKETLSSSRNSKSTKMRIGF